MTYWIEITIPPIKAGHYLVANKIYQYVGAARYMPKKCIWKFPSAQMGFEITHWAELPKPPTLANTSRPQPGH